MKLGNKSKPTATELIKETNRRILRLFSFEEKIRIVLEGLRGEESIAAVCRKYNIHQNLYLKGARTSWKQVINDFQETLFVKPILIRLKSCRIKMLI